LAATAHGGFRCGVTYESQADLARAHGIPTATVNDKIRKACAQGRTSVMFRIGLVEWD